MGRPRVRSIFSVILFHQKKSNRNKQIIISQQSISHLLNMIIQNTQEESLLEKSETNATGKTDKQSTTHPKKNRQHARDEIGTPFCITVDFETLEDGTVTVRDRDTMQQERIKS